MTDRIPRSVVFGAVVFAPMFLAYIAYSRPWYFTSQTYLGGLILLEFVIAAVWMYRRVFFPVLIMVFLLAGVNLPVGTVWTAARWLFLAIGAVFGLFITMREHRFHFGLFHLIAGFSILTALLSATVSRYPSVALLKILSLFLLFLYAATGARVAVTGRENSFFARLLLGCEVFVAVNAIFYSVGIEMMGNPNSLGAVMGVVGAPLLLWGTLVAEQRSVRHRRGALFAIAMCLGFVSHSRAGLAAAVVSCGLLCLALRKYKMFIEGMVVLTIVLAATGIFRPEFLTSTTSSVLYKGADEQRGILASRQSPWHAAMDNIREHPWFGTGLGTTADGGDPAGEHASFSSTAAVTAEHGSSYLSITVGVGTIGLLPFASLLLRLAGRIFHTVSWMCQHRLATHPAVPLATVMLAGIIHAAFEDWMFAAGNYLCVFFWVIAFVFIDASSFVKVHDFALSWRRHSGTAVSAAVRSNF